MALLAPLTDFHKSVVGACADDLRIYWDVRIVRGEELPFAHLTGSSSLPGMLAPNMVASAPSSIQGEVMDKIAKPLTSVLQAEAERQALGEPAVAAADGDGDVAPGTGAEEHPA